MQTQLINFSIPKPLLKALDTQAQKEIKSRSELLRDAIRSYLTNQATLSSITQYGKNQSKKLKIKSSQTEELVDEYRQGK